MFDGFVSSSKTNSVRQLPEKRHFRKMSILFHFLKRYLTCILLFLTTSSAVYTARIDYRLVVKKSQVHQNIFLVMSGSKNQSKFPIYYWSTTIWKLRFCWICQNFVKLKKIELCKRKHSAMQCKNMTKIDQVYAI